MVPLKCSWTYYPTKKGMISGVVLCSYALGAIFFSWMTSRIVNPDNESPGLYVTVGSSIEVLYHVDSTVV